MDPQQDDRDLELRRTQAVESVDNLLRFGGAVLAFAALIGLLVWAFSVLGH